MRWWREGAIVPLEVEDDSLGLGTAESKGVRTILAWPGATPTSFDVHEVDGSVLKVALRATATGWSVDLSAATAGAILRVRTEVAPAEVLGEGVTSTYDAARRTSAAVISLSRATTATITG